MNGNWMIRQRWRCGTTRRSKDGGGAEGRGWMVVVMRVGEGKGRLVSGIKGSEMILVEMVRGRHVVPDMEGTDLVAMTVGCGIVGMWSGRDVTGRR
ncbi:hypothetical protein Pcinc_011587 [Petrolisthes cinctipes]|uniref:Uncharacterized protein n=1 Tax=Petrolisthes cinctipes TaxID=88211 RepID=A0AAE1G2U8_PETCI|nr:hypothetical protein Pcinc_011587 [Petrolisthes cinctipes]